MSFTDAERVDAACEAMRRSLAHAPSCGTCHGTGWVDEARCPECWTPQADRSAARIAELVSACLAAVATIDACPPDSLPDDVIAARDALERTALF